MHATFDAAPLCYAIATHWEAPDVIFVKLLGVLFIVAVNGFFVVAEFSIVKIRSSQLDALIEKGDRRAVFARHVTEHLDAYLSATQLGVTMASLALGWVGEPYVAQLLEPFFALVGVTSATLINTVSVIVGFALITFLHITLGELGPKYIAINDPVGVSLRIIRPLGLFYAIFRPVIWVLNRSSNFILRDLFRRGAPLERGNHMIINGSRRRRIAKGSGTSVQDVNSLLKQYGQARKMMKSLSGSLMGNGVLAKKLGKMNLGGLLGGM